jgi:hypothetical protein
MDEFGKDDVGAVFWASKVSGFNNTTNDTTRSTVAISITDAL